jgi:hypothetical protein
MSFLDGYEGFDAQTNSKLLEAPYDFRCQIFSHLLSRHVHVFVHEDILRTSACIRCPEADDYYPGLERENDVSYDVWARRLRSTWEPHWKREEMMREGRANMNMNALLCTCKKL